MVDAAGQIVREAKVRSERETLVAWFAERGLTVLLEALRRIGLRFSQFANATCGTVGLKLLKIGAQVRVSVRRIKVAMASACPYQAEYHLA